MKKLEGDKYPQENIFGTLINGSIDFLLERRKYLATSGSKAFDEYDSMHQSYNQRLQESLELSLELQGRERDIYKETILQLDDKCKVALEQQRSTEFYNFERQWKTLNDKLINNRNVLGIIEEWKLKGLWLYDYL